MFEMYETLGVGKKATKPQIKKAYRDLAKKHHPDRKGGTVDKFQEIQKAYMVLYNDKSREEYDRTGESTGKVNSALSEAYASVASLFNTVIEQALGNLENVDFVEVCRKEINKHTSEALDGISKLETRASRLKLAGKRLSKKKKSKKKKSQNMRESVLEGVLSEQLTNCGKNIATLKKKIDVCKLMLIIIEDYNYKVDPKQTKAYTTFTGTSATTGA